MVEQNDSIHGAVFGYRPHVRLRMHQWPCVIAVALLAMRFPAYAADDAQGNGISGTPASGSTGTTASESGWSGLPGLPDPVVGASLCPLPNAVWQELVTLVPSEHLVSRLRGTGAAITSIQVEDIGTAFRISVLDKVRDYREEARDCAYRAKVAALFAALIIDPAALLNTALCESPPCSPKPTPTPTPPSPPPARAETKVFPATPSRPLVRLELGPTLVTGLGGEDRTVHWGGVLRLALGRGSVAAVLGAAGLLPAQTRIGGLRLQQWRLPLDLGIRATLSGARLDFYGEVGLAFALLSERALDLYASRSPIGMALGGRVGLGARLARRARLTPFVSLQADLFPDPPSVSALPQGRAGQTPRVWIGACAGASWGI